MLTWNLNIVCSHSKIPYTDTDTKRYRGWIINGVVSSSKKLTTVTKNLSQILENIEV